MTSSFTPGPWFTSPTHLGAARDIGAENGANICLVSGPKENGADEFKANAKLIAAAPDMYEALNELCERIEAVYGTDVHPTVAIGCRKAIRALAQVQP